MFNLLASACFRSTGGPPCFRIYGKGRSEKKWRVIDVLATHLRDQDSAWPAPFFRGTCITWTSSIIAVGWDFALEVLREQAHIPASRDHPVEVAGGRLRGLGVRLAAGGSPWPSSSEILAHECGHTWQARWLGWAYWPVGGSFTLFREGQHFWNRFENQASERGQFGGIVNDSVCPELMEQLKTPPPPSR